MGRRRAAGLAGAVVVALLACGLGRPAWAVDQQSAGAWRPRGIVEFVVGAGPGGENDRVARAIQQVFTKEHMVDSIGAATVGVRLKCLSLLH